MRRMMMLTLLALSALAGCSDVEIDEAKKQATGRWNNVRADMLVAVGQQHLTVGELAKAHKSAVDAMQLSPEHLKARILLGKVLLEQGHFALAGEQLAAACRQAPRHAEAAYLMGVAQEKQGQLVEALDSYLRSYELDNETLEPVRAAGEVMVAMGQLDQARQYVEGFMSRADGDPGMQELAGRLAAMNEQYDQAARYYAAAADLDPENVRYRETLARMFVRVGRAEEAVIELEALLAREEYEPPVWVHGLMGDAYLAAGRVRKARASFVTATELSPSSPELWAKLAEAELSLNDYTGARLAAEAALQLDPRCLQATLVTGYALLREGKCDRGIELMRSATYAHPRDPMVRVLLGRCYAGAGKHAEAVACYRAALQLAPDHALARELLRQAREEKLTQAR